MPATTLKLAGREFVILPKSEYATLKNRAGNGSIKRAKRHISKQDAGDLAEIARRRKEPGKNIPWEEAKRQLGL